MFSFNRKVSNFIGLFSKKTNPGFSNSKTNLPNELQDVLDSEPTESSSFNLKEEFEKLNLSISKVPNIFIEPDIFSSVHQSVLVEQKIMFDPVIYVTQYGEQEIRLIIDRTTALVLEPDREFETASDIYQQFIDFVAYRAKIHKQLCLIQELYHSEKIEPTHYVRLKKIPHDSLKDYECPLSNELINFPVKVTTQIIPKETDPNPEPYTEVHYFEYADFRTYWYKEFKHPFLDEENQILSVEFDLDYQLKVRNSVSLLVIGPSLKQIEAIIKEHENENYANDLENINFSYEQVPDEFVGFNPSGRIITHPVIVDDNCILDMNELKDYWNEDPINMYMNPYTEKPIKSLAYDHNRKKAIDEFMISNAVVKAQMEHNVSNFTQKNPWMSFTSQLSATSLTTLLAKEKNTSSIHPPQEPTSLTSRSRRNTI